VWAVHFSFNKNLGHMPYKEPLLLRMRYGMDNLSHLLSMYNILAEFLNFLTTKIERNA